MIELMFAAALSGVRAAATSTAADRASVESSLELEPVEPSKPAAAGTRPLPRPELSFTEDKECPVFFQREVAGFGTVKLGPRCATEGSK